MWFKGYSHFHELVPDGQTESHIAIYAKSDYFTHLQANQSFRTKMKINFLWLFSDSNQSKAGLVYCYVVLCMEAPKGSTSSVPLRRWSHDLVYSDRLVEAGIERGTPGYKVTFFWLLK